MSSTTLSRDNGFVESFNREMGALVPSPNDFNSIVKEALKDALGDSPSRYLESLIGDNGLKEPEVFARQSVRFLGTGARSLLSAVEEYATSHLVKGL